MKLPNKKMNPSSFLNLFLKANSSIKTMIADSVFTRYETTILLSRRGSSRAFNTHMWPTKTPVVITINLNKKFVSMEFIKN